MIWCFADGLLLWGGYSETVWAQISADGEERIEQFGYGFMLLRIGNCCRANSRRDGVVFVCSDGV
ncbi:hypothetical protein D0T90_03320 [Neisseria animalis]|uniref:Uncharacterized protein n=1 Tax=Neisseria animalis TaxID=492 RepID=A0A5P3MQD9_NEIAN|nr:hypothetical protein D0T90_03320 [Neisseria animalis]